VCLLFVPQPTVTHMCQRSAGDHGCSMFSIPTFNLTVDVYTNGAYPPNAKRTTFPCNLQGGRAIRMSDAAFVNGWSMHLLLPKGSDIRSFVTAGGQDLVDVPAGSGRHYLVMGVDDIGKGFANEFRWALLFPTNAFGSWPVPIP